MQRFIITRGEKPVKRIGMKCIKTFKKDNEVVGITTLRDKLIVATKKGVYTYPKGNL